MTTHRQEVDAILAGSAAEHRALLDAVSPALRSSLPVDATGITQALEHVAGAVGSSEGFRAEQARAHQSNAAVLHGRVFGREPLAPATVLAAFADGARVRARTLVELADAIGGESLAEAIAAALHAHPLPGADDGGDDAAITALRAAYAAQERAVATLADALDARA
jgi:hypothetical protein